MTHRHRVLAIVLVVLLVAGSAITAVTAISGVLGSDGDARLTVSWGGGEGRPSCAYDPGTGTVAALLVIRGEAPAGSELSITVSAYADENTSERVGAVHAHGIDAVFSVLHRPCTLDEALGEAAANVELAARNLAASLLVGAGLAPLLRP